MESFKKGLFVCVKLILVMRLVLERGTLEEDDLQIVVSAADSKLSSCKQSSSPAAIPGAEGLRQGDLEVEKNVENILLRLSREVGDVGARDIIFKGEN
jgi:hypothetical protein